MKLTKQEKTAITTVIKLVFDICEETPMGECQNCPFWTYCEHADESVAHYLDHLFAKVLEKST